MKPSYRCRRVCRGVACALFAVAFGCGEPSIVVEEDASAPFDATVGAPEESATDCADGRDNDGDGLVDCADVACVVHAFCVTPRESGALCANGTDDDGDGATDCADPDCEGAPACALDAGVRDGGMDARVAIDGGGSDAGPLWTDAGVDGSVGSTDAPFMLADAPTTPPDGRAPNPRPAGTPDVLFIAVSGHCDPRTCGTAPNEEYLGGAGTITALERPFVDAGAIVGAEYFTDNFYDEPTALPPSIGFLHLLNELEWARDTLVADWDNPTRIIVVAHSHGTVWAHTALHVLEQRGAPIPVDILIDFDAVSWGWEAKVAAGFGDAWSNVIVEYTTRTGTAWPFGIWNATDSWGVPGVVALQDVEDVVPNSVRNNFEIWSREPPSFPPEACDREPNHRMDGSAFPAAAIGLSFFPSTEDHSGCDNPGSDAVEWATNGIRFLYGL